MGKIATKLREIKEGIRNDENLTRGRKGFVRGIKGLPSSTGKYLVRKIPFVHWFPNYAPRWLVDDMIAGVTVALVLIPQALASAALAGIPLQQGLFASWLPSVIYFFMGTSKDIATGPTTSLSLLTNAVVLSITAEGFPVPPALIASGLSFSIGTFSLLFGLLNLGWILNFVTVPMLVGFQMSAALIIVQGMQIPKNIATTQPLSLAVGVASIVIIILLKLMGKKWGHKSSIIRILSNLRNAFVIAISTTISFIINKDLVIPQFPIAGTVALTLQSPQLPTKLVLLVAKKSFPVSFIAAIAQHLIFAKSFAREHNYEIDESQELVFLGTANIVNSFFGGMPVSGSLSLSAVNSTTGVRSPLSGLFSAGFVFLAINMLTETFQWIPTAATSAIILVAVGETLPPNSIPLTYWKGSFADFIGFFVVMNVALVTSLELALGLGIVYIALYTLLRTLFSSISPLKPHDIENRYSFESVNRMSIPLQGGRLVPQGTQLITLETPLIYLNAERVKKDILEAIWTYHEPTPYGPTERNGWSDYRVRRTAALRRRSNINTPTRFLPRLEVIVFNFTRVTFIDTTGLTYLQDLKDEIMAYSGDAVELRFVGMIDSVQKKFKRVGWPLGTYQESQIGLVAGIDIIFEDLHDAVAAPRSVRASMNGLDFGFANPRNDMEQFGDEEAFEKGRMNVIVTNVVTKDGRAYKEKM
ncbi:sulfate permease [Botrytis cinerea]